MHSIGTWWMWCAFAIIVLAMLAVDLLVFKNGHQHKVSLKEAAGWSIAWVTVALLFNAGLWWYLDATAGREVANTDALAFLAAYLLEKSLAVDNVFVWMMIFSFFGISVELQRRVLLYGILGAVVLRTVMIFAGSWLITQFDWILYIFGAFLIITGIKMALGKDEEPDLENNVLIRWLCKRYRISEHLEGEKFFAMRDGVRYMTPLFLALILVEISDIVFAVDSIPAVFAITKDPFIVLTSNLFAILGLRAMYFLLADLSDRFVLLKYGLAIILTFIGTKMLIVEWIHIPVSLSLGFVVLVLVATAILSLRYSARHKKPS